MKPKGVVAFNKQHAADFPWAEAVPGDRTSARCKLCNRTFSISSMGRTAFVSHAEGKKHVTAAKASRCTPSALLFGCPTTGDKGPSTSSSSDRALEGPSESEGAGDLRPELPAQVHAAAPDLVQVSASSSAPPHSVETSTSSTPSQPSLMKRYLLNESVTKAEILWCLEAVTKIHSNRSAADCASLFSVMFPDSMIAQKMQLHRDKVGYLSVYGLAPYFRKLLVDQLELCDFVALGFDEALNAISTKKQMDLVVRYWDFQSNLVSTRYLTSVFLRGASASELKEGIREAIGVKIETKLLHLSMDGPAVNFKLLKDLQSALVEEHHISMLDLGSCGLHVVHGAFKTAAECVSWGLKEFLMATHFLFKDSPARRGHFIKTTGSHVFAIPFCFTRWIENAKAGSRAMAMLPQLKVWIEQVRREGTKNDLNKGHKQFDRVVKALKDKLLGPKLAFFVSTAEMVEPFLTKFQSNDPMAPLLFRELQSLTVALMDRLVKKSVMKQATKISKVDLKELNLLPASEFDLGFTTKAAIREASKAGKLAESDVLRFRTECRQFFVRMVEKIQERSPLGYKMTRAVSCLDPFVVRETPSLAKERVSLALEILCTQKNRISGAKADRIKSSFNAMIALPSTSTRLEQFDGTVPRLDIVWMDVVAAAPPSVPSKSDLSDFLRMILILYHSNAALERSFSLNNECMVVNQKETSLIAHRVVQDAVLSAGGVGKVEISKSMVHSARNSYACYKEAKELRSREEKRAAEKIAVKRKAAKELKELKEKKVKIMKEARDAASTIDLKIQSLEEENN